MTRLAGIYRALVVDSQDPEKKQRLKVRIPDVIPGIDLWAIPCMEAGSRLLPLVGATVWVMFEQGDADRPVWLGVLPSSAR
jgi:hypothetical protein